MKTIKIIFFNPSIYFELISEPLDDDLDLIKVPLNYEITEADLHMERTVILLYYSDIGQRKVKELKKRFPGLPCIFLAKHANKNDLLQALRLGISDFLFLPVKAKELRRAIDDAINSREKSQAVPSLWLKLQSYFSKKVLAFRKILLDRPDQSPNGLDALEIIAPGSRIWMKESLSSAQTPDIQVKFFGNFELKVRGKELPPLRGSKNKSLLAYMLFQVEKSIHRDELINAFWDIRTGGRNSLNVAICNIRKYFSRHLPEQEFILLENEFYCINPELEVVSDVDQFIKLWKKGRSIELSQGLPSALGAYHRALTYYDNDLLEEMRFEDWCESFRDNFKETYLFILNRLSAHFFQRREYDACIAICRRMLQKDACQEDVHRKLMECYNHLGMHDLARHQYFKCERILSQELKIKPSGQTKKLYQQIGG